MVDINHSAAKRIILFVFGILLVGSGISLVTKAGLGTTAITSFSYVLSFLFPPSLGTFVFSVNTFMAAVQLVILRRHGMLRTRSEQIRLLLQIPSALLFGSSIDLFLLLLRGIELHSYLLHILLLLAGCVVFGAGVAMEVSANVIVLPAEALMKVISEVYHKDFGAVKTAFDVSMCALAAVISLAGLGHIAGIREGTVISALIVGSISRFFLKLIGRYIYPGKN